MARQIKETPVLVGKDAARFEKNSKANENRRISSKELSQAKAAYHQFGFAEKTN